MSFRGKNSKYYKSITEILKKYYKYAKRIEKNMLKGYNNFALIVKQKVQRYFKVRWKSVWSSLKQKNK